LRPLRGYSPVRMDFLPEGTRQWRCRSSPEEESMSVSRPVRILALAAVAIAALAVGGAALAAKPKPKCDRLCAQQKILKRNSDNVVAYYTMAFNDGDARGAVAKYGGAEYIQHNPLAANGFDAFITFVESFKKAFPDAHIDIKRVVAQGNMVVTHALATGAVPVYGPRGSKVVDIFRLDAQGKIVEHWDVLAQISATSANGNPEV
jgi:predicted SnoaL-like aldol condensation-catalyzing enzyme